MSIQGGSCVVVDGVVVWLYIDRLCVLGIDQKLP
jgi:hypothetical protein